jgi:hypothetical protein
MQNGGRLIRNAETSGERFTKELATQHVRPHRGLMRHSMSSSCCAATIADLSESSSPMEITGLPKWLQSRFRANFD